MSDRPGRAGAGATQFGRRRHGGGRQSRSATETVVTLARRASTAVRRAFRQIRRTGVARRPGLSVPVRPVRRSAPPPQLAVLRRDLRTLRRARAIGAAWRTYCSLTGTSCAPRRTRHQLAAPNAATAPTHSTGPDATAGMRLPWMCSGEAMHSRAAALLCAFMSSMALFAAATAALAQTYQGTIRGIVRDAQGIIPAAEVTLVNESTSAARTVITNEVGEYVFPSVLPGTYTLACLAPGVPDRGANRPAVGDAAASGAGLHARSRRAVGTDHRERRVAAGRARLSHRGDVADRRGHHGAADLRPQHLLLRDRHAERDSDRRPAVRPLSGSVERVVPVARRRAAAWQRLSRRGRLDHRLRQPPVVDALD